LKWLDLITTKVRIISRRGKTFIGNICRNCWILTWLTGVFVPPRIWKPKKQYNMSQGVAPVYSGKCASLTQKEAKDLLEQGKRASFVFGRPKKRFSFNDVVRGKIDFDGALIGDFCDSKRLG